MEPTVEENSSPPLFTAAVVEANVFYLIEGLEGLQCLEGLEGPEHLECLEGLKGLTRVEVLEGLKGLHRISHQGDFVRLERLEGLGIMEGLEGVEVLESLKPQSWAFGYFFRFLTLKKTINTKTGLEIDMPFSCDRSSGSLFSLDFYISRFNKLRYYVVYS